MHPVYSLSVLSCEGRYHTGSVASVSRERFEVGLSVQGQSYALYRCLVMRRTCIPAPPQESEPAIVNTERSGVVLIKVRKGNILRIIL